MMTKPSTGFPVDGGPEWFTFGFPTKTYLCPISLKNNNKFGFPTMMRILGEVTLSLLLAGPRSVCPIRRKKRFVTARDIF